MTSRDWKLDSAYKRIMDSYGADVDIDRKSKSLIKWGENSLVGTTKATLMTLPVGQLHETFVSTNAITHVSSSSGSDTGTIRYEYHTVDANGLNFGVSGNVTLQGQTAVALPVPCARISRAYSTSQVTMVGDVYFHEGGTVSSGVPTDATKVHMILQAGESQTQKAQTSVSYQDYWIITNLSISLLEKSASWSQTRIEIKPYNSDIWLPITQWFAVSDSTGSLYVNFDVYKIVPSNYDVRLVAIADGANTKVSGGVAGYLAIKVNDND